MISCILSRGSLNATWDFQNWLQPERFSFGTLMRWKLNRTMEPSAHKNRFDHLAGTSHFRDRDIHANVCLIRAHSDYMYALPFAFAGWMRANMKRNETRGRGREEREIEREIRGREKNVKRSEREMVWERFFAKSTCNITSVAFESRFYHEMRKFFFIKCKFCLEFSSLLPKCSRTHIARYLFR